MVNIYSSEFQQNAKRKDFIAPLRSDDKNTNEVIKYLVLRDILVADVDKYNDLENIFKIILLVVPKSFINFVEMDEPNKSCLRQHP